MVGSRGWSRGRKLIPRPREPGPNGGNYDNSANIDDGRPGTVYAGFDDCPQWRWRWQKFNLRPEALLQS